MAEKFTTLDQLRLLAGRTAAGLEDVQHTGMTVTLPCANWNGRAQTIHHELLLANDMYWYFVCGDADCFMECSDAGIKADNITVNGQATFRCEITPERDLTVNILRLEVET